MLRSECPQCGKKIVLIEMAASDRVVALDLSPERRYVISKKNKAAVVSTFQKHKCEGGE